MAWIESHDDIWEHHKTVRLQKMLGISDVAAVGHLQSLWHFVLRNAWRDADLSPWGDDGIEAAARWRGQPGAFVKAMRAVNFLDDSVVHGWIERAGKLVQDRLYNEERKVYAVKRRKSTFLRRKTDATLPYPTLPNQHITDSSDSAKPKNPKNPEIKHLIDYFFEQCQLVKGFKPAISGGRDGARAKAVLEEMKLPEAKAVIDLFLRSKKAKEMGVSLAAALSAHSINLYRQSLSRDVDEEGQRARELTKRVLSEQGGNTF